MVRLLPLCVLALWLALMPALVPARSPAGLASARVVAIPAIQGLGAASPLVGERVATTGVVTLVLPRGFFMQDPAGDGDPRTSDGLFVFTGWPPRIAAGDAVQVTGLVTEYAMGSKPGREAHGTLTELTSVKVVRLGSGARVPTAPLVLPLAPGADLERLEGMRVLVRAPLAVLEPPRTPRGGSFTASCGPRLLAPTDVARPGAEAQRVAERNARCRILLDVVPRDGAPALRAGDALGDIVGVVGDTPAPGARAASVARIHPEAWTPKHAPPRPAQPPPVGGTLRVAGVNAHNFFTTLNDGRTPCFPGSPRDCRGARTPAEFVRQRDKLVEALVRLDADVVALMEIENSAEALDALVVALNGRQGRRYAAVRDGRARAAPGRGDAIQVALIYRPDRLTADGPASWDLSPVHDRPPLAQAFRTHAGDTFTVVASHFKSKRCDRARGADADIGDQQGCFNGRRTAQARALRQFATRLAGSGDVLLIGDFNAHAQEDPLQVLREGGAFVDELARFAAPRGAALYTYVFDGVAGRLDHVLTSRSLSRKVTGAGVWHVNADEAPGAGSDTDPVRSSDHDPVLVGLDLDGGPSRGPAPQGPDTGSAAAGLKRPR